MPATWMQKSFYGRGARTPHLVLPGRKALCGTHMGYGNLVSAPEHPGQRRCQRCEAIAQRMTETTETETTETETETDMPTETESTTVLTIAETHWHSGQNLPGYLPESEVDCAETWEDAKEQMISRLVDASDSTATWADEHDCDDVPCPTYGDSCPEQIASSLRFAAEDLNLSDGPEWGDIIGGVSYWITQTPADDCDETYVTQIQTRVPHLSSAGVWAELQATEGGDIISDAAAVTIASWWQSPGTVGRHLASLASGSPVSPDALLDDIDATEREAETSVPGLNRSDRRALAVLRSWVLAQIERA